MNLSIFNRLFLLALIKFKAMNALKSFMLLFLITFPLYLKCQEVITTAGDYFKAEGNSISSTIGEPVGETFTGAETILTQGFQQSKLKILAIKENKNPDLTISIYPNPASEQVTLTVKNGGPEKISYQLIDQAGRTLYGNSLKLPESVLSVQRLPAGVYFLRIFAGNEDMKVYKIIKQ
jgi:hypothetical protein